MTIPEIHKNLVEKKISAIELTKECIKKIEKEDKEIGAFLSFTPKLALKQAECAQKKIEKEREKSHLLCGIPCAIKDNILVEGLKCTAGSKILEDYIAPYDATAILKLKKAGAVILGKTNMDEFAMGSSTENSAFFKTKNPLDKTRVPGGSSGGSVAAVAADFCQFSLGSDTGGSIRQPAGFCGVVGLKPTYGAVSRYGLIAFASSLDQIGPITKTVEDAKIVFEAIRGWDEMDSTSVNSKFEIRNSKPRSNPFGMLRGWQIPNSKFQIPNLRIGIPKEYFVKGIEPEVEKIIKRVIKKYEELGAKIEEISLPHTEYALACYYIIAPSEASSNLARYDGIRYGIKESQISNLPPTPRLRRAGKSQNLTEFYLKVRGRFFGKEVKRRILMGTFALSAGYYDEYYLRAQKVRRCIKEDFKKAFLNVDCILTPVSPTLPFKLGERISDPIKMYLADVFTTPASLAGLPALSLPYGKVGELSTGVQLIARPFEEDLIFKVAKKFEQSKNG